MVTQPLRIRLIFEKNHSVTQQPQPQSHRTWILIQPNHHPKISDVSNHLLHNFNHLLTSSPKRILLLMKGFVLPLSESTRILKNDDIVCVRRNEIVALNKESTAPDGAKKVASRSARRKKAKRIWKQELSKILHNPYNHVEPEVSKTEIKAQEPYKLPAEIVHKNIKIEERNFNGDMDSELVPCAAKPGHSQFEPLDEAVLHPFGQREVQSLRIRLMFEDGSVSQQQRSQGLNRSWILIEPDHHPKISDVCNNLINKFNLHSSCPNGIIVFMKEFVLPPSESTQILKDDDIVCVRRNELALNERFKRREVVDNDMVHIENKEFDRATGGYQSELEDAEVVKMEEESSHKETTSKKRKTSSKLRSSKTKKHPSPVMDGVEDILATDENNISKKKIKPNEELQKKNAETSDKNLEQGVKQTSTAPDVAKKVPSRTSRRKKEQRRRRRELAKISHNPGNHVEPEVSNTEIKEANDLLERPIKLPAEIVHTNIIKQEEIYFDGDADSELVPCVVKPGHTQFEPLDEGVYNIVPLPVQQCPIVICKMEEDDPDNSLYKEDGSLEINCAALAYVRSVEQRNADAVNSVSIGAEQTPTVDENNVVSNLMPNTNNAKANLSEDPSRGKMDDSVSSCATFGYGLS